MFFNEKRERKPATSLEVVGGLINPKCNPPLVYPETTADVEVTFVASIERRAVFDDSAGLKNFFGHRTVSPLSRKVPAKTRAEAAIHRTRRLTFSRRGLNDKKKRFPPRRVFRPEFGTPSTR